MDPLTRPETYAEPQMRGSQSDKRPARIARLRLSLIRTDAGTQTRARIDDVTVAEYAERMIAGDRFPPVVVFRSNGTYLLADGFHRLLARKLAKFERIDAEVRQGTRLDALKFSLSANHQHGLRRTNEDKRHAVEIALREFPGWADRAIAQVCGVSHPSVGAARRQLVNFTSCGKRLGRDGKHRRLAVKQGKSREPYALPGSPANGAERAAHDLTLEVAQMFGNLETTVKSALSRFPGERHLILGLIQKVKSDLTHLEQEIGPAET
jgi:hypothetical protein